jgi:hypothetical protein
MHGQPSFSAWASGRVAPIPAVQGAAIEPLESTEAVQKREEV